MTMHNLLRLASLAALLAVLCGCPLSSDTSAPDVQGTWDATLTYSDGSQVSAIAAILAGGPGFIYTDKGDFYGLSPLKDERTLDGSMLHNTNQRIACSGCGDSSALVGTAYSDELVMDATVTDPGTAGPPPQTGIRMTRSQPLTDQQSLELSQLTLNGTTVPSGQWQGYYLPSNTAISLSMNSTGFFTGTDGFGCALSGHIVIDNSAMVTAGESSRDQNVFEVALKGALSIDGTCDADLTGVGYYSGTGTGPFKGVPGTYFFMGVYSSPLNTVTTTGYMLEFKLP